MVQSIMLFSGRNVGGKMACSNNIHDPMIQLTYMVAVFLTVSAHIYPELVLQLSSLSNG